jgi:hypothetical protein
MIEPDEMPRGLSIRAGKVTRRTGSWLAPAEARE